jgi:hypothetical protein
MDMFGNGFSDGVGAGFCEVVCKQSGVFGEGVEFGDGEVSFREGPGLVKENSRGVLCVLNRLNGLVAIGWKVGVSKMKKTGVAIRSP